MFKIRQVLKTKYWKSIKSVWKTRLFQDFGPTVLTRSFSLTSLRFVTSNRRRNLRWFNFRTRRSNNPSFLAATRVLTEICSKRKHIF